MCFVQVGKDGGISLPENKVILTGKDSDLKLLSTGKKGTKIPPVFRKIIEIKNDSLLTQEEYLSFKDQLLEDDKILIGLRCRAIQLKIKDRFDFIINKNEKSI